MGDSLLTDLMVRIPWFGPRALLRLQRAGRAFDVVDWPELARQTVRQRPDVVSLDVFDTCLIRDLAGDQAIEHSIDNSGHDAEAMERLLCRPVPGAAEALHQIRQAEAQVVFVSDTDRSSQLLSDILRSHGLFVDGDHLVASCEAGATKSEGRLFDQIWPAGPERPTVWHAGNHLWADVAMAAAAGLTPFPLLQADSNRFETAMAARPDGPGPALAGAARLARLEIEAARRAGTLSDHQAATESLGADVAGQAMGAFVLWIAEQCRREGIDHLGFLARDGELPLRLAEAIPADHWDGRSLRYLHCSRLTWSLAAASALGVEQWMAEGTAHDEAFLHIKRNEIPFEALLARIGLQPGDLAAEAKHRRLADLDPGRELPAGAVEDWESLLADQAVRERIAVRADERFKLIVDFLRAENMPAGRYGLVDVGWRGRLAWHVSAVMSEVVGEEPIHLHFGGDKVIPEVDAKIEIKRFAFDGLSAPRPIEAPVSCVETMTASGKPRVVDYRRRQDGAVELVFDDAAVESGGDREELWAGALRMAALIPSRSTFRDLGIGHVPLDAEVRAVLDLWWNHSTAAEVEAFRGLSFEHDEAGTAIRPLVAPYRFGELRPGGERAARQWPQGSAVISSRSMAVLARLTWFGRRLGRRFAR